MEIFKQLKKLGYKHYAVLTVEELDKVPIDNVERRVECSLIIDFFRERHNIVVEVWYDETQVDVDGFTWLYEIYVDDIAHDHDGSYYDDFYECREEAILKAIKLCKEKNL